MFSKEWFLSLIVSIPGLLIAITFHEFAHGWAAYLMGDRTAKYSGRLSLNPIHHLDPIGAICMLLFRFGWAKPVPINPNNFKNHRLGVIVVSLAGPFANFLLGLISTILLGVIISFEQPIVGAVGATFYQFLLYIFIYSTVMNTGFMVFNLIPIPPLDGSKIVLEFLPYKAKFWVYQYERYFSLVLIVLVYAGFTANFLPFFSERIISLYSNIIGIFSPNAELVIRWLMGV